jgi:hypothetical protein
MPRKLCAGADSVKAASILEPFPMSDLDTDKIVAAIFTASTCAGKNVDTETYINTYEGFIDLMKKRKSEKSPGASKAIVGSLMNPTKSSEVSRKPNR